MRNAERGTRNPRPGRGAGAVLSALALVCFGAGTLRAQPAQFVASATADRPRMSLADSVRVTLAIEGPAPMRAAVELPKQLLTADADGSWRIRPEGEIGITPLPNGRERWHRVYRLDPYAPGAPLRATFAPATVHKQAVTWPPVEVIVERTGGDSAPLPESRPVTTVEDVPPPIDPPPQEARTALVVAGAGALVCLVLFGAAWSRWRKEAPVSPREWARGALAQLEASSLPGAERAERVAAVLRQFVERLFALPATQLTTTELCAKADQQAWPTDEVQALRELLDECDLAKFARHAPDADACQCLIRAAGAWIDGAGRVPEPGA